jgi:TldD protein
MSQTDTILLDTEIHFPDGVYSDVRLERVAKWELTIRDGELEAIVPAVEVGALLRVLKNGSWYYAYTTELDHIDAKLKEMAANEALGAGQNQGVEDILEAHQASHRQFDSARIDHIDVQQKRHELCCRLDLLDHPHIQSWTAHWSDVHRDRRFLSSKGADVSHDYQECGFSYRFAMAHGDETFTESFRKGANHFQELVDNREAYTKEMVAYLAKCARFLLSAEPVVPGHYPVILAPPATGVFAHESFGHKSEADFMLGDPEALAAWATGSKVGSELLSLVDDGSLSGSGYVPYDDEGQPNKKVYLIKDGRLTGRLHSATTAKALKEPLTGNARALSFRFEPIVRMRTTYIEPGESSLEELLSTIQDGYFIETIRHGSGMSTFTIAPSLAWRIRDGKIAEPARVAVITGSVFETLGLIDGVTKESRIDCIVGGGCGKFEQVPLAVGFGGPYVRVSKMQVA